MTLFHGDRDHEMDDGPMILTDEDGFMWEVVDFDQSLVESLVRYYDRPRDSGVVFAADQQRAVAFSESVDEEAAMLAWPLPWSIYSCPMTNSKWVYNFGIQTDLHTTAGDQERGSVGDGLNVGGSFVIVGEDLVLTAGHVGVSTNPRNPSQICVRDSSGTECRSALSQFENGSTNCSNDWTLVRTSAPFTLPIQPFDLASGSDSYLQQQSPRLSGYPTLRMGYESTCGIAVFMDGERNAGSFNDVYPMHVRLNISAGGNHSGGPYYFLHSTQQRFKLFGIHRGRVVSGSDRYACGPKIPYHRNTIIAAGNALGGTF